MAFVRVWRLDLLAECPPLRRIRSACVQEHRAPGRARGLDGVGYAGSSRVAEKVADRERVAAAIERERRTPRGETRIDTRRSLDGGFLQPRRTIPVVHQHVR